jgi:phasin
MSEIEKNISAATKATRRALPSPQPKSENADVFGLGNSIEVPEMFRDAAEKGAKQAKDAYEKMRSAAEEATDLLEDQFESARSGFMALNSKALDAAKANTDATFRFAKDVMAVKTVAEVIELQTSFARQQYELFSAQAKEMQDLVQKVTTEAAQPVKDAFSKIVKDVRAA